MAFIYSITYFFEKTKIPANLLLRSTVRDMTDLEISSNQFAESETSHCIEKLLLLFEMFERMIMN